MTIVTRAAATAVFVAASLAPSIAAAQDERFRVAFGPAAATGAGDASLAIAGSFGYRFSERIAFEVELTGIGSPADRFSDHPILMDEGVQGMARLGNLMTLGARFGAMSRRAPGGLGVLPAIGQLSAATDGSTVVGTMGFRYDLPVQGGRLSPYFGAGLGLARTHEDFSVTRTETSWAIADSVSHTGIAMSAGVGASLRVYKTLSVDFDTRYFRLSRDRNVIRFGGGVSYRF